MYISLSAKSKSANVKASAVDPPAPSDEEPARRYPRRNLPPTNYAALESPNEDDFICKLCESLCLFSKNWVFPKMEEGAYIFQFQGPRMGEEWMILNKAQLRFQLKNENWSFTDVELRFKFI